MSLRRFRKQAEGLSLEKLNRGEIRRRKKKAADEEDGEEGEEDDELQVGLRPGKGEGATEMFVLIIPFFFFSSSKAHLVCVSDCFVDK